MSEILETLGGSQRRLREEKGRAFEGRVIRHIYTFFGAKLEDPDHLGFNRGVFSDFPVRLRCSVRVLSGDDLWTPKSIGLFRGEFDQLKEESQGPCGLIFPSVNHRAGDAWVMHDFNLLLYEGAALRFTFVMGDGDLTGVVEKLSTFLGVMRENRWRV